VGRHPVFEPLRAEAAKLAAGATGEAAFLSTQTTWDPFAFINLCEANADARATWNDLCRRVQRIEWELLFGFCYHSAAGNHESPL
jgi:hypothetical protein